MLSEDEILDAYGALDDLELVRKLEACQRRIAMLEARLRQRSEPVVAPEPRKAREWREQAEKYERLYLAVLARNEILNRKVRDGL